MADPESALDARFSDPDASVTSWAHTVAVIEAASIFWISTVRVDRRPHVTPLVAVWLDDALHFSMGAEEQKARNVAANPRVALTTGTDDWTSGLDVVVEGVAARVTDHDRLVRLAGRWAEKWDGSWRYEVRDGAFHHDAAHRHRLRRRAGEGAGLREAPVQPHPASVLSGVLETSPWPRD